MSNLKKISFNSIKEGKTLCYIYFFGLIEIKKATIHLTENESLAIYENYLIKPLFFIYDNEFNVFRAEFEVIKEFNFNIFAYLKDIEDSNIISKEDFNQIITEITLQYDYNEDYIKELHSEFC